MGFVPGRTRPANDLKSRGVVAADRVGLSAERPHLQCGGAPNGLSPDAVVFKRERPTTAQQWIQNYRWGRYEPALYRKFAQCGMPRSDVREAFRDWGHFFAIFAALSRKHSWSDWRRASATRVGRAVGSVLERRLYL
jgi:hypothetical protein